MAGSLVPELKIWGEDSSWKGLSDFVVPLVEDEVRPVIYTFATHMLCELLAAGDGACGFYVRIEGYGAESPQDLLTLIRRIKGQASRVNHVRHFDLPQ
ncbi:uncharacterized protein ARMOST_14817 [Armillaria ostoyae]|uniref:Uncharacterized protein n=1 Tax=Armillaria ostoyae TaxID=47428 RepID=A0A284RRN3_ARMOS|nr:uncharacterized protein ARMOST_14817 [Armillaria ostoyae]